MNKILRMIKFILFLKVVKKINSSQFTTDLEKFNDPSIKTEQETFINFRDKNISSINTESNEDFVIV